MLQKYRPGEGGLGGIAGFLEGGRVKGEMFMAGRDRVVGERRWVLGAGKGRVCVGQGTTSSVPGRGASTRDQGLRAAAGATLQKHAARREADLQGSPAR